MVGIFLLPYHFPPKRPAIGLSYVVGYNNTLAILIVVVLSLGTLIAAYMSTDPFNVPKTETRLSRRYLLTTTAVIFAWQLFLSVVVLRHSGRSIEDTYFLPQLEKAYVYHLKLYTQIEFAYGPLLFYPTVWLAHLCSSFAYPIEIAYYITLIVEHIFGIYLLFFVVNRLPMSHRMRSAVFLAISIAALNPLMGLNYTLFRFCAPIAALVWVAEERSLWTTNLGAFFFAFGLLYLSPELYIAFSVAVLCLCTLKMPRGGWRRAMPVTLVFLSGLAGIALSQKSQFSPLKRFAGGFNAVPLLPTPELLLVLLASIWLAPQIASAALKVVRGDSDLPESDRSAVVVALYAFGLSILPALLTVGEILHFVMNGIPFFLLGSVAMSGQARPARSAWVAALFGVYALMLVRFNYVAEPYFRATLACFDTTNRVERHLGVLSRLMGRTPHSIALESCPAYVSEEQITNVIGKSTFSVPLWQPAFTSAHLAYSRSFLPGYFNVHIDLWGPDAQRIAIADMRRSDWIVAPPEPGNGLIGPALGLFPPEHTISFTERHRVLTQDLIAQEIQRNWIRVKALDESSSLYKKVR